MKKNLKKKALAAAICASMAAMSLPASAGRPANKPAYVWGTVSVGSGISVTTLTGVTSLDRVTLESMLTTGDPNENGEGENLIWTLGAHDDGGKLDQYGVLYTQGFLAGSANPILDAAIQGADGDESATIKITVDPAPPPDWIPQDIKDMARVNSRNAENNAAALGTAKEVCKALEKAGALSFKYLCTFIGQGKTTEENWGKILNDIANDPSDPNYKVIAVPVTPQLTAPPVGDMPQPLADAFNALLANQAESIGVMNAIITSTNRATGAYDGDDDAWMAAQAAAVTKYRLQLGGLVQKKIVLLQNLKSAWTQYGATPITVNANDIFNYELSLLYYGFDAEDTKTYTELGLSAADINMARMRVAARDVNAGVGTYPDMLTNSTYISQLQALSDKLQYAPLAEGQQIKAEGVFNSPSGSSVTFVLRVGMQNGTLVGSLQEKDHASDSSFGFQAATFTSAGIGGSKGIAEGTYQGNNNSTGTFRIMVDRGNGSNANVSIILSNGLQLNAPLAGGDIKLPNPTNN